MADNRPNILYFVADQMRADAQHHLGNSAAKTPNLDALAEEGVSFRNAYCQNPVCVPSRCSFLSGLYPHTTGHRTMHYLQREEEPNILRIMKQAGYEVIWTHRNDVLPGGTPKTDYCDAYYDGIHEENLRDHSAPVDFGKLHGNGAKPKFNKDMYSFYLGKVPEERFGFQDANAVKSVLNYLDQRKKEGHDKPFFVYCTLMFPHPPYGVSDPWYSMIDRNALPPRKKWSEDKPSMLKETADKMELHDWSEDRWNELRAVYLGMTAKFDDQLGQVMNKLKETGEYDNTNVFCFSDHGDYTGDYDIVEKLQNCFDDDLTNIPLVIKPAKNIAVKPRITNALAELVDLNATVSEMTGVELGYLQYGKSLVHVLTGDEEHKEAVFSEGGRDHGDIPSMESGHKNPEDMYWPRISTQQEEGPQHTKATMVRMGNLKYTMRLYEKDELYDLDKDPEERVNVIDDPAYAQQVMKMKAKMLDWYQETADFVPLKEDKR